MKRNTKKKIAYAGAFFIIAGIASGVYYVFIHKPDIVANPCWRSCHLANGRCKVSFDKAWKANWQSLKQFLLHGEICNAYQVGELFYTGHSKHAWFRNINPFK